jgi:hypothetical protein
MNSLILLLDGQSGWSPEEWVLTHGGKRGMADEVVVGNVEEWLSVVCDEKVLNDYNDSELETLSTLLTTPIPFLIRWRGHKLVENLLNSIPKERKAIVDNDHGVITSLEAVRSLPIMSWSRIKQLE